MKVDEGQGFSTGDWKGPLKWRNVWIWHRRAWYTNELHHKIDSIVYTTNKTSYKILTMRKLLASDSPFRARAPDHNLMSKYHKISLQQATIWQVISWEKGLEKSGRLDQKTSWSTEFLQIESCVKYKSISTSRFFQTPSHPFCINDPINLLCHEVSMTQSFRLKTSYSVMRTWFCSKRQDIDPAAISNTKIKQVKRKWNLTTEGVFFIDIILQT